MPASLLSLAGIVVLFGPFVADADQLAELPGDVIAALAYVANWRFILADTVLRRPVHRARRRCSTSGRWRSRSSSTCSSRCSWRASCWRCGRAPGGCSVACARRPRRRCPRCRCSCSTSPARTRPACYYGTGTRAAELLLGALLAVVVAGRAPTS